MKGAAARAAYTTLALTLAVGACGSHSPQRHVLTGHVAVTSVNLALLGVAGAARLNGATPLVNGAACPSVSDLGVAHGAEVLVKDDGRLSRNRRPW
ncbi:MAG: hypothetical protein QOG65_3321 [Actinomycetota bacterium]|nr:hypothetical protein [Actinomycetota bacterium]